MSGREQARGAERARATSEPKPERYEVWLVEGVDVWEDEEREEKDNQADEPEHGEIWVVQDDKQAYVRGKPRPAVVVQDMMKSGGLDSVTVCILTTNEERAFYRILVNPDEVNGLDKPSRLMVDKVTTVSRESLKKRIGTLDQTIMDEFFDRLIEFMTPGDVSPM